MNLPFATTVQKTNTYKFKESTCFRLNTSTYIKVVYFNNITDTLIKNVHMPYNK